MKRLIQYKTMMYSAGHTNQSHLLVFSKFVHTSASVLTDAWILDTFVDVLQTSWSTEGSCTLAGEVITMSSTGASIMTRLRGTKVFLLTLFTCERNKIEKYTLSFTSSSNSQHMFKDTINGHQKQPKAQLTCDLYTGPTQVIQY